MHYHVYVNDGYGKVTEPYEIFSTSLEAEKQVCEDFGAPLEEQVTIFEHDAMMIEYDPETVRIAGCLGIGKKPQSCGLVKI